MAFCSKCGKEVEEGARFCANCGAPVESTESVAVKTEADNINVSEQSAVAAETRAPAAPVEVAEPAVPAPAAPTAPAVQNYDVAETAVEETTIVEHNKLTDFFNNLQLDSLASKMPALAKMAGISNLVMPDINDMENQAATTGVKFVCGKNELTLKQNELQMNGETGFWLFKKKVYFSQSYSDIMFFDYTARFFGLLGYKLRGGTNNQFFLKGIKKSDCITIRKFMINHGMRVSSRKIKEGKTYTGFGLPFRKESVTVADDGVLHSIKGIFKNLDSFVPYDKVDFFLISKRFLLLRKLTVVGQLSFSTKQFYSIAAANNAKSELKRKCGKIEDGKVYHPHLFSGEKYKRKTRLILCEDKILYIGPHWELSEDQRHAQLRSKTENIIVLRKVTDYSCHPIFSLFDRTAWIRGRGTVDIRTKTAEEQTIVFPGVFFFWWACCGRIKAACERLS